MLRNLLPSYLSGTYCHKTSTRPPSCATPRQWTMYPLFRSPLSLHVCYLDPACKWVYLFTILRVLPSLWAALSLWLSWSFAHEKYKIKTQWVDRFLSKIIFYCNENIWTSWTQVLIVTKREHDFRELIENALSSRALQ